MKITLITKITLIMKRIFFLALWVAFLGGANVYAGCEIRGSFAAKDALSELLKGQMDCPKNVIEFRDLLLSQGLSLRPSMVANRGFHNTSLGSFSFFETVEGDSRSPRIRIAEGEFFFGHFTEERAGLIELQQTPDAGALMIELIAWDESKGAFNFYELIGDGVAGKWFYRGDSFDIFADNQKLHLQKDPAKPEFGSRLRCSACHVNGGPIMKELAAPHNDWWTEGRALPFSPHTESARVAALTRTLLPAEIFAKKVLGGLNRLNGDVRFQNYLKSLSLRERLRPLFCPMEVNFASDLRPLSSPSKEIQIPSEFLVDSRLATGSGTVTRLSYLKALEAVNSRFLQDGGEGARDADHAWLTPVKADSDKLLVKDLVAQGVIDSEFVFDVLSVDFINPVTSEGRCSLLKWVPSRFSKDWKREFQANLSAVPGASAEELLKNMTLKERNQSAHQSKAQSYLQASFANLAADGMDAKWMNLLNRRRQEIRDSEISKNPRGQILEPGFRVIFPVFSP